LYAGCAEQVFQTSEKPRESCDTRKLTMIFPEIPRGSCGLTIFLHFQRYSQAWSGQRLALGVSSSPPRPGRCELATGNLKSSISNQAYAATSHESGELSTAALQEALYGPKPASILCFRWFLQSGLDLAQIRMVVSEFGDSPMRASLKLLASIALSIGLAPAAFAHNSIDFRDTDGTLMAGYKAAAGFPNGVIFSGNFVGPVSWTLTTLSNGTQHCALTGVLTGMTGGAAINAITVQFTINTVNMDRGPDGSATISGGETNREESVPEPSTLTLLGTGSLALLGVMRRRSGATRN
jgi:hypothetical protein